MSAILLRLVIGALLAVLAASASPAQQSVIGPGDTLRITVLGEPEQSRQVVVDDDGRISLPLAKDIQVDGLTTSGAADAVREKLKQFIKNPDVTVELVQKAQRRVTIAGQVKSPGVYSVERGARLMQGIGLASGFLETADKWRVTVTRRGASLPLTCDLEAFVAGNLESANVELQEGDVVSVPERSPAIGTVFVYGAVKAPGQPVPLREGMCVSQAISAAGGILPDQADPNRATLKREGVTEPLQIDLARALAGDPAADLGLIHGDTITIPAVERVGTYTIYGAVANSGEFPLKTNTTISRALAAASVAREAKITDVRLTRAPGGAGKPESIKVNVSDISAGKSADMVLQPGDTIFVPAREQREQATRWLAVGVSLLTILLRR